VRVYAAHAGKMNIETKLFKIGQEANMPPETTTTAATKTPRFKVATN